MPPSQISGSVALKDCGFAVKPYASLYARPPADFPCFNELVGKHRPTRYVDVILSKKQLVDYLRLALERVHERKEVQLESDRRAAAAFVMASRDASKASPPVLIEVVAVRPTPTALAAKTAVKTAFRSAARFVEGPSAATHAATAAASVAAL